MINFEYYTFNELSSHQLYHILKLRSEVFVVEQQCFELDIDGKDFQAIHFVGCENNNIVAYLRVFTPTDTTKKLKFGRLLTAQSVRHKGYGKNLMEVFIQYCEKYFPKISIECSAQLYLQRFYESFRFRVEGEPYDEGGIPHVYMRKEN